MTTLLTVQSDGTLYLDTRHPGCRDLEDKLMRFAELDANKPPFLKYRIHRVSLWNAAIAGMESADVLGCLEAATDKPLPEKVVGVVGRHMARVQWLVLINQGSDLVLRPTRKGLLKKLAGLKRIQILLPNISENDEQVIVPPHLRGELKRTLAALGYPVQDQAGHAEGEFLDVTMRTNTRSEGQHFGLRPYQNEALTSHLAGTWNGGSGVVVLPCGAGKTLVALAAIAKLKTRALILVTNITACRQWIREIRDRLDLPEDAVGEYTGAHKQVRPITVATYQALTYRVPGTEHFPHMEILGSENWGLVVYDEVHLLPAPVFRLTAGLQGMRRLGLTATLVREDGLETDVFSLIGPRQFEVPWRELEGRYIATAICHEVRVPLPMQERITYLRTKGRGRDRLASENPAKIALAQALVERHNGESILVIGQYLDQLDALSAALDAPLLTGQTPQKEREVLYADFRAGVIPVLVVSKVANFAVDLPDASVAIQVSGTFGSRQEEAQRLGRILRPKAQEANFYSLVSEATKEEIWQEKRKRFLSEQGYSYRMWRSAEFTEDPHCELAHA